MAEYRNLEYGSVIHRPIAFDGAAALVSGATHDEPANGTSEIVLDDDYLDGIDLTGKELVVSIPNDPNDAYRVARVVRNTTDTLWINDPGTYSAADAIDAGRPFVVYDFEGSVQEAGVSFTVLTVTYLSGPDQTVLECTPYFHAVGWTIEGDLYLAEVVEVDPGVSYVVAGDQTDNFAAMSAYVATPPAHAVTKGTGGEWTGSPTYASSETTFTDSGADFQAYMVGWLLQPDVELPSYLEIVDVVSATAIKVKGDADTLASAGSTYRIHAPPGVSATTGALITDLEESGSHWLWAGYEYVPPMVGFADPAGQDPGTYGAQPGGNKVGSYHCWTRVYEAQTGRWTTPDPFSSSWIKPFGYANEYPLGQSDPSGLEASLGYEIIQPLTIPWNCGAYIEKIQWIVPPNFTGYIVQEVRKIGVVFDCNGVQLLSFDDHYWEAWEVVNGVVYGGHKRDSSRSGYDIGFFAIGPGPMKGSVTSYRIAQLVKAGDLRPGPSTWIAANPGKSLPKTIRMPAGWDRSKGIHRITHFAFSCCEGSPKGSFVWGNIHPFIIGSTDVYPYGYNNRVLSQRPKVTDKNCEDFAKEAYKPVG
ncbi:MAG: hypothetical protein IPK87_00030 [Planctomycetes bacterium]|nr:hypothetical protein [Planctomycetota bacterium]